MKKHLVLLLLLAALWLCACGEGENRAAEETPAPTASVAPTPEPAPEPTPEPAPEPTPRPTSLTLTGESAEEILAYAGWTELEEIDATACREYEALLALQEALPDCRIEWLYEYGGQSRSSLRTEELKAADTEGLVEALRFLPGVKRVDLLEAEVPDEEKDALLALRPDVDFLWTVQFARWTVRSDLAAFSTLHGKDEYRYTNEELAPLFKYCRHLKVLDLGHNNLTDLRPIAELKELQALIIADNPKLTDASPIVALTNLNYLELFKCAQVESFDFLRQMPQLTAVNLCFEPALDDPSLFDGMEGLEIAWLRCTGLDAEARETLKQRHPDAEFSFSWLKQGSCTDAGWRMTEENIALRTALLNWPNVVSYENWTHFEFAEGVTPRRASAAWEDYG